MEHLYCANFSKDEKVVSYVSAQSWRQSQVSVDQAMDLPNLKLADYDHASQVFVKVWSLTPFFNQFYSSYQSKYYQSDAIQLSAYNFRIVQQMVQISNFNQLTAVLKLIKMSRITEQLLRKRSQHNECMLTTLEQISLHQQQLIKIENLDILCRHLKIIYLQNNIIEKMENLNKLKELEYLNLALNNISRIENIEGCESLKKLDMTVNFIDVLDLHDSAMCLSKLPNLKELYLTGNPCENWPGCKDYIIANVPTLQAYNGQIITPSQRIKAQQLLPSLKASLFEAIEKRKLQLKQERYDQEQRKKLEATLSEQEKAKLKTPYTRQSRRQMYEKMAEQKERKERERNPDKYKQEKPIKMYTNNGEIRQCNEGKFKFTLREFDDPDYSYFEIEVPKHLETSQLEVNINPKWLSVRIKRQLTQVKLGQEIIVHESKSQRSSITGALLITMRKLHSHEFLRKTKQQQAQRKKKEQQEKKRAQKEEREKRLRLCDQYEKKMQQQQDQIPDLQ